MASVKYKLYISEEACLYSVNEWTFAREQCRFTKYNKRMLELALQILKYIVVFKQ